MSTNDLQDWSHLDDEEDEELTGDEIRVYLPEKQRAPEREAVFIPDVHGNPRSLLFSLDKAGIIKMTGDYSWTVVPGQEEIAVTLLGDYVDRGPDSLTVLRLISTLRGDLKNIDALFGDHELSVVAALHSPKAKDHWVKHGGDTVVANLKQETAIDDDTSPAFNDAAKKILLEGEIGNVLRSLQICTRNGAVLGIHAGVGDTLAEMILEEGIDSVRQFYRREVFNLDEPGRLVTLATHDSRLTDPLWMRRMFPGFMTGQRAAILNEAGIYTVVRGHDHAIDNPVMQILPTNGKGGSIRVIHLDTNMWKRDGWTYLRMRPDGTLKGESDLGNTVEIRKESV
jgi:hypothetical protein